jgi:uncharacterized Fe-S cluster-containing protein
MMYIQLSEDMKVDMVASPLGDEGQIIICRECGALMRSDVIQRGGTIRYVCTRNFGHILYVQQNN